jgi:hypothetical protein
MRRGWKLSLLVAFWSVHVDEGWSTILGEIACGGEARVRFGGPREVMMRNSE